MNSANKAIGYIEPNQTFEPFDYKRLTAIGQQQYRFDGTRIIIRSENSEPFDVSSERGVPCYWQQHSSSEHDWILRTKGKPSTITNLNTFLGTLMHEVASKECIDFRTLLVQSACEAAHSYQTLYGKDPLSPRTENGYPDRSGENDKGDPFRDAMDNGAHCSFGLTQLLLSTARSVRPDLFAGVKRDQHRYILGQPRNAFDCLAALIKTYKEPDRNDPLRLRVKLGAGGVYPKSGRWGVVLYNESVILHWIAFWNDAAHILFNS